MLRALFRDSAIYTFSGLISRVLSLCLVPVYMIALTPNEYGKLDLLLIFASVAHLTVSFEISQGLARYYSFENCKFHKSEYFSTALWFTMFCYFVFSLIALFFSESFSILLMGSSGNSNVINNTVLYIFINGILLLVLNQFRWSMQSKVYAVVSVLISIVTAFFSIILLFNFCLGVLSLIYGSTLGAFFGLIVCFLRLYKDINFKFNFIKLIEMLRFSMPLVPSGVAVFVNSYFDRIMISHFISVEDLGIYGIGFRIASSVGICILGFSSAMTPLIYKHYSDKSTPSKISDLFRIFVAFALISNFLVNIGSRFFFNIAEFSRYSNAIHVIVYLVPAILLAQMYVFAPGIDIVKKTHLVLWIQVAGAFVNVVLNFFTIPIFGITGAAFSTLSGSLVVFVFYMYFSQKYYYVNHNWFRIFLAIFFYYVLYAISSSIDKFDANFIFFQTFILAMCIMIIFITRLLSINDVYKLFKLLKN